MNPRPEPEAGNSSDGLRFGIDPDGIGLATFDDPVRGQNVLTLEALETLDGVLAEAEAAASGGSLRALMFRSAKPGSFIAGVDVNMIAGFDDASRGVEATRRGQALFDRIAAMPVPTVAAIRGVCLGGGTELALACDHRVADDRDRTRIGLPEVLLGILPALGGTTRLPRLVGLSAALDLMLTGKAARVSKAHRIGLIDRILPRQQFDERTLELARRLARGEGMPPGGGPRRRTLAGRLLDGTIPGRALILRTAARQVRKRTGGHYPAPFRILEVASKGVRGSVAASLEREARAFGGLIASPECKNLLFVFRMRERARKPPWSDGGRGRPVGRIAVLGAGPMGGGIAQVAAYNGIPVRMKDIRHEAVAGGLAHARSIFDGAVRRRSLRKGDANARMGLISGGIDYAGVGSAGVVVEAVVERMEVKHAVLREVEGVVAPDAVIATNTSSLSVDEMAQALDRPERFAGMHFFNPVHRMPLVEVVRGADTSADTVETLAGLAVRLGKIPVVARDAPGFLVNRILGPCLNEAGHMLGEDWDAVAIDRAWKRFGMPMGPFRLIDEIGIDVMSHAGDSMAQAFGKRMAPAPALVALAISGRLGRKGGKGFYRYEGGREKGFDQAVYADMKLPGTRTAPDDARVRDRLVFAVVNEAARVLEERVVESAADVDLAMVMGTGFPPFRGGPLKYADDRGPAEVLRTLEVLEATCGHRFAPSPLVRELGQSGETFHAAFPAGGE